MSHVLFGANSQFQGAKKNMGHFVVNAEEPLLLSVLHIGAVVNSFFLFKTYDFALRHPQLSSGTIRRLFIYFRFIKPDNILPITSILFLNLLCSS